MQKILWVVVAIIVIVGGYWWWQGTQAPAESNAADATAGDTADVTTAPMPVIGSTTQETIVAPTVTYDGKTFSPSAVTIKKGGTVTWKNTSSGKMWVASAQHPTHTVYSGTSRSEHCPDTSNTTFDQCEGGGDYSFTFDKVGTWNYHDHINAGVFGKVIVE